MEMSAGPGEEWYPSGRDGGRQPPRPGSLTPKPGCMCCACGDLVGPTSLAPRRPQAPHDAVGVWCTKRRAGLSPSSLPPLHPSARPAPGRRAPEAAKDPARERGPRRADPAVSPCPHRYNERMGRGTPTAPRGSRNDSAPAGQF